MLKSLLNNAQDAVSILDLQGNILQVNPAWESLYGWTQDEVVGMLNPTANKDDVMHWVKRVINHEPILPFDGFAYRRDGTPLYVSASLYPIHSADGNVIAMVGSTRDVAARKEAERKLRESEEKYRLIADNIQDLIGVLDKEGRVIYASPSHKTVLGFSSDQYKGKSALEFIHPDDRMNVRKQFAHMVSSETPRQAEFRYQHADGHWVYVEAKGTPACNNGEADRFLVVARDVTERKKADELLRKSEKLALAGQLAAALAHEIRNPLTAIQGFAQLLQKESDNQVYVGTMLSEISRLNDVVNVLLTLSKPQVGKGRATRPQSLLDQALMFVSSQASLYNIHIKRGYDFDLPLIECDKNQMKQVFINVLQNAIEAMPGGGTITVQISLPDQHSVRFRFVDQGSGISEERLKHIKEPFYSSKEKGTGLGLMVSHKIVQEHGGSLNIDSVVNQGTTVDVILPIYDSNRSKHQISPG